MQIDHILRITSASKQRLMKRFDLKGLKMYIFLPTFVPAYKIKLSKRIVEFGGQINLTVKNSDQLVIVSDNVIDLALENIQAQRLEMKNSQRQFEAKENLSGNVTSKRTKKILLSGSHSLSERHLYENFMQEQTENAKNQKVEILDEFKQILKLKCPIIKITDLNYVLDYFESFSKFEWHTKRDGSRLLKSLINADGCLIITSRK
jgi:hypothetical protein